jgi:hypothetical protein
MDLVRDLLDKQLLGRNEKKMGKVDGIVLEFDEGARPRVVRIETGAATAARRLHPRLAGWARRLTRLWGDREGACRVEWSKVLVVAGGDVKVDVDAEATTAFALERWLRDRVVGRIPGA